MRMGERASGNLVIQIYNSLKAPEFWAYSGWLDIITRYRRTRFGLFWMLMPPLLYVGGIGYFYAKLLNADVGSFIPHLGLGYLVFRMTSMVITESAVMLNANQAFILDGHARLTDFTFKVIFKALFYFFSAFPIIAAVLWLAPGFDLLGGVQALAGLLLVLANLVWLSTVIGLLGARFPDVHELMGSIFIFAFILTPILWGAERAPVGTAHGILMRANPLFHLIEIVRAPLLGKALDVTTLPYTVAMTLAGVALAYVFYRRYSKFVPVWL